MADFLHELIRQQIAALDSNIKFVFVQPAYLPQHTVLQMFLQEPACLYVHFDGNDLDDVALQSILQNALAEQFPSGSLTDVRLLILDEHDRVLLNDLETLLTNLLPAANLRILLLGRLIPDFVRTNKAI